MSSPLRAALRSRLTIAMRERDRAVTAALRNAVAAIENAEAVPVADGPMVGGSADIAGAALGVGATEAARLVLDPAAERHVVASELAALLEAEGAYAAAGDPERAATAAAGAEALRDVLTELADPS
ncbi:hypothetical protein [Terrabacter terrigena]|uniref:Glutamyl-tRNA amidotransferase n=1 Tax=Terrabacter terrigena TaxID=574718 RepID=A0ABW3MWY5_9MICO